jgi:uncharacterized spore protein YtfJ
MATNDREVRSMRLEDIVNRAQDAISVRRVFGEPVTHDGVMVIPVASVAAGVGGGSGSDAERGGEGEGGGFGARGRPVGVYVIRDGEVSWQPAMDVNRAIVWTSITLMAVVLVASRRRRAR